MRASDDDAAVKNIWSQRFESKNISIASSLPLGMFSIGSRALTDGYGPDDDYDVFA